MIAEGKRYAVADAVEDQQEIDEKLSRGWKIAAVYAGGRGVYLVLTP